MSPGELLHVPSWVVYEHQPTSSRRIIEPLTSRCSKFRFTPLDVESTRSRLQHIAQSERITLSPQTLDALISTSEGDLRRSITYLQSASRLSVASNPPTAITPKDIQEIAGVVPDAVVGKFLNALGVDMPNQVDPDAMDIDGGGVIKARRVKGFDDVREEVRAVIRQGYSTSQLISQVLNNQFHSLEIRNAHADFTDP